VFKLDRVTSDPDIAHESNFLHPVIYYFKEPPQKTDDMLSQADMVHHMLEDFLTMWTDIRNHQSYLLKFYESILGVDLQSYSRRECAVLRSVRDNWPVRCRIHFSHVCKVKLQENNEIKHRW